LEKVSLEAMRQHFYSVGMPVTVHSSNPNHKPHNGQMATIKNKIDGDGLVIYSVELPDSRRLAVGESDIIPFDV